MEIKHREKLDIKNRVDISLTDDAKLILEVFLAASWNSRNTLSTRYIVEEFVDYEKHTNRILNALKDLIKNEIIGVSYNVSFDEAEFEIEALAGYYLTNRGKLLLSLIGEWL